MAKKRILSISKNQLGRLPNYVHHLQALRAVGIEKVTAPQVARDLNLNVELVKKDFALVAKRQGTPRSGRDISELITDMYDFLEYSQHDKAILIGVGSLGKALLHYRGFDDYGFNIVAAFDVDSALIGSKVDGIPIYNLDDLEKVQSERRSQIAIITVPAKEAQKVATRLISANIAAIWNFAPAHLKVPSRIIVQDENMASSLAIISHRLKEKQRAKK
ncbi:MAG TPA: redox-sensing transcriptional repressor Rex [Bacilli bacterium]|nr:redox-sensing transcriptional repressor Rex [Bacilli bacterium]